MPEEVNFEPNRFAAAARHYVTGRPAYAQKLISRIVTELRLGAEDTVMDLGCGGPELGTFRLATIGRAFHWMDRSDTLQRLDAMIAKGGAVALFSDSHPKHRTNPWVEPFRRIIDEYTAGDAERSRRRSADWPSNEEALLASPFARLERCSVIEKRTLPAALLVERALSMSSINDGRPGRRVEP